VAAGGFFGIEDLAVEGDFVDAAAALDEVGIEAEFSFQRGRQTGGSWLVVSNHAVFDSDASHGGLPERAVRRDVRAALGGELWTAPVHSR
jgi:hypothetical protein